MKKRLLALLLTCSMIFSGVIATTISVNAEESVNFGYTDFESVIKTLVSSLQAIEDKDLRTARFVFYLDTVVSKDSEIDARIAELNSDSELTDNMLKDLTKEGITKDQIKFALQFLKSFPEAERSAAVEEFYYNQDNGAKYEFTEEVAAAYEAIYDEYVNEEFQATVLEDYDLEYIDFVPFIRLITNNILFTEQSGKKLGILAVAPEFGDAVKANVTATEVNGSAIADEFGVVDEFADKFNAADKKDLLKNMITVFKAEDAYEIVGNISGDEDGKVDMIDAAVMTQYFAEWKAVEKAVNESNSRYYAGAMIHPDKKLTTADAVKLLQFLAEYDGIILGRDLSK